MRIARHALDPFLGFARSRGTLLAGLLTLLLYAVPSSAADVVPTDVQLPGTQPGEVGALDTATNCDNCHGDRSKGVEISHEWRGSMMAHAGRDPIFWATMAIAEQDFDGAGDLCLRCHATAGWLGGRSTPTDGSGLASNDDDGVECSYCHGLTNPDNSEHLGAQFGDFIANDGGSPAQGYYASGMGVLWAGQEKLGPYQEGDAAPKHQFMASNFHRSVDFCGTCHDVSNSVVGDLAHNHGTQATADPVVASGVPGAPVAGKAAFNNFPYQYGIVERTFSESKSGLLIGTRVGAYPDLPAELQAGALAEAYTRSMLAGTNGDYADGAPRYFSCQTCHMGPVEGLGCNKPGVPLRPDLPSHDMTGGNYWMPEVIQYLDAQGKLRLGGGLTADEIAGLDAGALRAKHNLENAAALEVTGSTLRIVNLTGHKLISGYPEGRRMWINVRWYEGAGGTGAIVREDGAYGPLFDALGSPVEVVNPADGQPVQVRSILDLDDPNTRIYEVHHALTQEWASQLIDLGYPADLALSYDRHTGAVEHTLGGLAAEEPGHYEESFHFVLNNKVSFDNRIPTYGMGYDTARARNVLPVPADQYGNPGPGETYQHWDEFELQPPTGAASGVIRLLYQPTSWEYIQFLDRANNGSNAFLGNEGTYMLEAWLNTPTLMAEPHVMASTTVEAPEPGALALLAAGVACLGALARRRGGRCARA
ncbi:MAG TPA: hypothetical protein VIY27_08930 [Myxococcota bacterium]